MLTIYTINRKTEIYILIEVNITGLINKTRIFIYLFIYNANKSPIQKTQSPIC